MEEPIEHSYFNWLCAKVLDNSFGYELMKILYSTEFVWVIQQDRHRADDGLELRQDFLREIRIESDARWEELPCSILELLIAFAQRAQFQTDIPTKEWFWIFMTNLGLDDLRCQIDVDINIARTILNNFIWRTYKRNGFGGLFPMSHTRNDQREIELWYQFNEWVDDQRLA